MEIAAILKLAPVVLSVVEIVKRVIPDKKRDVVNPVIAVVTGLIGAYTIGGQQEVLTVLYQGVLAAATAIGAYKIPKIVGERLGIE